MSPGKPWQSVGPRYLRMPSSMEQPPVLRWCYFETEYSPGVRHQFLHMCNVVFRDLCSRYKVMYM